MQVLRHWNRGAVALAGASLRPAIVAILAASVLMGGRCTTLAGEPQPKRADLWHTIFQYAPPAADHSADEVTEPSVIKYHARESWSGAAVTRYGWSIYSGLTWAPFGNNGVQRDGWRLRLSGGYTKYKYGSSYWNGHTNETLTYYGTGSFTDLYAGYHKQLGPLTVKAFVGASIGADVIVPLDPGNSIQGKTFGAKAVLETWYNISPVIWLSADASLASAHSSYALNARLGYRLTPSLSFGPELAHFGNEQSSGSRIGGFARYEWDSGELSASAGISGDIQLRDKADGSPHAAYGTINWVRRF